MSSAAETFTKNSSRASGGKLRGGVPLAASNKKLPQNQMFAAVLCIWGNVTERQLRS